jgi:hypothetical protein
MSKGSARLTSFGKVPACATEAYYDGDSLQRTVAAAGNVASSMRSSTPRSFQRDVPVLHRADPPERVLGMAKEQLRKPNSGVGMTMSSPRVGVPLPASARDVVKPRQAVRSLRLCHVRRPAVWASDVAAKKHRDATDALLTALRKREVTRVVDEWRASGTTEERLLDLGYMPDDARSLAKHLVGDAQLVSLPTNDRKRIEAFRMKLGEACIDRLMSMPPADTDMTLQQHGFSAKERCSIIDAIDSTKDRAVV